MAKDKKSVLIYVDWINIFEELSDEEAGKLVKHLFRYVNDKNPEAPDRLTKLLFEQIKQTLKRDLINYESTCNKNRENALMRWNKLHAVACDGIKADAKHADIDSDNDIDKDSVSDKEKNNYIEFEIFWNLYDKKVDRGKCEPKWKKLLESEQIECIEKLPEYIKATPDKKFRRDPETYLNNKSWQNEIIKTENNGINKHDLEWRRKHPNESWNQAN